MNNLYERLKIASKEPKNNFMLSFEEVDEIIDIIEENKKIKTELQLYKDNHIYLNDKIDKTIKYIKNCQVYGMRSGKTLFNEIIKKIIDLLQGSNN